MKDVLQEIVAYKRLELEQMRAKKPSLSAALLQSGSGIIAEFKRRSPSKGWIKEEGSASRIPLGYQRAGAAAVSVLTDKHFFGGHDRFVAEARQSGVTVPILYKNFIVDSLQLYEAALCGASAVLLIAAVLSRQACAALIGQAHELGLEVLLELHDERELDYADLPADCLGVNNRNLGTFVTDVENSFRLADRLPKDRVLVSESGISRPETIRALRTVGFRGFLIGETFMREADPTACLAQFISEL